MHNFRIPPSPTWYSQAVCTPNNGFLYIAGNHTSIAYIPPIDQNAAESIGQAKCTPQLESNLRVIQTPNTNRKFKTIACDPDWSESSKFVTMNEQNVIWVWNLETGKICSGHRGHEMSQNGNAHDKYGSSSSAGGAMCITRDRQVLSIDQNAFVKYCLASNTYHTLPENFIPKRSAITLMKSSPFDNNMVAFGYRNGLILIANTDEFQILQTLRGHDASIVSFEWMKTSLSNNNVTTNAVEVIEKASIETPEKSSVAPAKKLSKAVENILQNDSPRKVAATSPMKNAPTSSKAADRKAPIMARRAQDARREPPKPIVDADDMFDMFSFDYEAPEFGTTSRPTQSSIKTTTDPAEDDDNEIEEHQKSICESNDDFDFMEECQSLRSQIEISKKAEPQEADGADAVNMSDINQMKAADGNADLDISLLSLKSTIGSSHNESELDELENIIKSMKINEAENELFLASGSLENSVVIWGVKDGRIVDKIQFKSTHTRAVIPKPNCTIAWFRPNELIICCTGKVSQWKSAPNEMRFVETESKFSEAAVISIYSNAEFEHVQPTVWSSSMHMILQAHQLKGEDVETVASMATLPIGMFAIEICPHDEHKIAIAGNNKRISILDLVLMKQHSIKIQPFTMKIQGKVLSLAWNPVLENHLSFTTNEGRVGTFDLFKQQNPPDIAKHFNGTDLYGIAYARNRKDNKSLLYAINGKKVMLFDENYGRSADHKHIEYKEAVTAICVNDKFVTIGFYNGLVEILSSEEHKKIAELSVSSKYITSIAWSHSDDTLMAIGTYDSNIVLIKLNTFGLAEIGRLTGHTGVVTSVKWSKMNPNWIVSASADCSIRVWDTETKKCIAWAEYEHRMTCAIFMPTDEHFIMCSGQGETMNFFDIRKRLISDVGELDSKKRKKDIEKNMQWARKVQTEASKLRELEKKKLRNLEKKQKELKTEPTEESKQVSTAGKHSQFKYTTILCLSNKELNRNPLILLEKLIKGSAAEISNNDDTDDESPKTNFLHEQLFGSRESVRLVLKKELQNHLNSSTGSIGSVLVPMIGYELREKIMLSIKAKSLTELELSVAPMISYDFWKQCSYAFAMQCIEEGSIIQAVPHLLATHRSTDAIDRLSETHLYREAWCIAKMTKEAEDPTFEKIASKWFKYLEETGNLEGAALISFLAKKPKTAVEILGRRKVKTPQIETLIELLSKIQADSQ